MYKNHGQNFLEAGNESFICTKLQRISDAVLIDNDTVTEVFRLNKFERFQDQSLASTETPRIVFYLGQKVRRADSSDVYHPHEYIGFATVSTRYLQNELRLRANEQAQDSFVNLYLGDFILDKDGVVLAHIDAAIDPRALWVLKEHFGLGITDLVGRINYQPLVFKGLQEELQTKLHEHLIAQAHEKASNP